MFAYKFYVIMIVMKAIIVAYDRNYGIGANNDLLWKKDLPADLKHFKEFTTNNAVIMGHSTFNSIGKALPSRQNIVISHQNMSIDNVQIVDSLQKAYDLVEPSKDAFIIGGGQIYHLAFDKVDQIFATEIDATFKQATVFFPAVDLAQWREISREKHIADDYNLYNYDFVTYQRR
jgi:dihydrofolate reductase